MSNLVNDDEVSIDGFEIKSGEFTLASEGPHEARIYGLIDMGIQPQTYNNEPTAPQRVLRVLFEVFEDDGSSNTARKDYPLKPSPKSGISNLLKAVYGTTDVKELNQHFKTLPKMVGMPLQVRIEHNAKGTYANIKETTAMTAKAKQHVQALTQETVVFIQARSDAEEVFRTKLTDRTRAEIMSSLDKDHHKDEIKEAWLNMQMNNPQLGETVQRVEQQRHAILG